MIKGGYILQPRKIDESAISCSPPHVREIWHYLLRKANHKDKTISSKTFKRGQLLTSYKQIINDLRWNVGYRTERYKKHHCETAMKVLTKEQMINTTKTTRGFIVTILNYDYYQSPKNYETDSETDNETDNEPTMNRHYIQEWKNENNDNNKKKFNFKSELLNLGVDKNIASDWLEVRRKKRAANTETALNKLKTEIEKSGLSANECIKISAERSWQGFNHKWLDNEKNRSNNRNGFKSDTTRQTIESFEARVNSKR